MKYSLQPTAKYVHKIILSTQNFKVKEDQTWLEWHVNRPESINNKHTLEMEPSSCACSSNIRSKTNLCDHDQRFNKKAKTWK